MNSSRSRCHLGFQLMEMLTVLAIISIVTALSLPIYSQYLMSAHRVEAAGFLSKLALALEQYHLEHNTYAGATLTELQIPELVAKNNYQLAIRSADMNDFVLGAQPLSKQAEKDQRCGVLLLSAEGEKSISGSGTINECW